MITVFRSALLAYVIIFVAAVIFLAMGLLDLPINPLPKYALGFLNMMSYPWTLLIPPIQGQIWYITPMALPLINLVILNFLVGFANRVSKHLA